LLLTVNAAVNFLVYSCCTVAFRERVVQAVGAVRRCSAPPIDRGTEMIRRSINRAHSKMSRRESLQEEEPILDQEVLV
jgi:hypothetical protein